MAGFVFQGWKCISSFNFGFILYLNTSLANFQSQYGQFLYQLSNSMDSNNTNIVTVNAINSVNQSQLSSMPNLNNIVGIVGNITLSS